MPRRVEQRLEARSARPVVPERILAAVLATPDLVVEPARRVGRARSRRRCRRFPRARGGRRAAAARHRRPARRRPGRPAPRHRRGTAARSAPRTGRRPGRRAARTPRRSRIGHAVVAADAVCVSVGLRRRNELRARASRLPGSQRARTAAISSPAGASRCGRPCRPRACAAGPRAARSRSRHDQGSGRVPAAASRRRISRATAGPSSPGMKPSSRTRSKGSAASRFERRGTV